MTYGEIKIETLRLMFINAQDEINVEWLNVYADDETYRSYLSNMIGSMNRCLSNVEEKRIVPSRSKTLLYDDGKVSGAFIRFDLKTFIEDYFDLERVVYETDSGDYCADSEYRREGDVLVLPFFEKDEGITYTVVYKPKLRRVSFATANTDEIDLPEGIACYVPYYLKGELYRDDEPNEAAEARNQFEQLMSEIAERSVSKSNQVSTVYSQTEW